MFFFILRTHNFSFFAVLFLLLFASCSTGPAPDEFNPNGTFTEAGLQEAKVNVLHLRDEVLFAGTDQGLFKRDLGSSSNEWKYLGLDTDSASIVDIIAWNAENLLVAKGYLLDTEPPFYPNKTLFKTENGGVNWINLTVNFEGENIDSHIDHLAFSIEKPDRLFAFSALRIAHSLDRGQNWEAVYSTWKTMPAFSGFVKVVPGHPNIIWSGGANNIFQAVVIISTDGGTTWKFQRVYKGTDATVQDVVFHPDNPALVLAGLSGSVSPARVIRKSTDGGQTWETVLQGLNTYTFTRSAHEPRIIYASGRSAPSTLFFVVSTDFGETWQWVETEKFIPPVFIHDMVSVMEDGHEVLYFATNKGVYSYHFEK